MDTDFIIHMTILMAIILYDQLIVLAIIDSLDSKHIQYFRYKFVTYM